MGKTFVGLLLLFSCLSLRTQQPAHTGTDPNLLIGERLKSVRYDLRIEHGRFAGSGATVISDAVTQARWLLVGEDHFTREIPEFTSALCRLTANQGLAGMALEVSPEAADFVSSRLWQPDRWQQMIALTEQYPASVAFVDSKQENDLIANCAQASGNPSFHVWGLDQTFLGSAGWLIDRMLGGSPGPESKLELDALRRTAARDAEAAQSSGQYASLFLLASSTSQQLQAAAPSIAKDGGPQVQRIFQELQLSDEIYSEQANGGDGNFQRARLLKQNFLTAMQSLSPGEKNQKVIVKFGEWHLYKGFNPLHHLDLGNFIAEEADVRGETSLHICILGAKGIHRSYGKYAQPSTTKSFSSLEDPWYRWMVPAINDQVQDGWTLYDLRKLRFEKFTGLDPDFARVIDGYDLLVVIPEISPAELAH